MIQLFKNGKLVDYGTRKNVGFYIRLGYEVRVLNEEETKEWKAKNQIKRVWHTLPSVLKKRIGFLIRNVALSWQEKLTHMINVLKTISCRAYSFNITHRMTKSQASLIQQIKAAWDFTKSIFQPITPAAYALAN